jgi:HEPN domain-containing protein
MNVGKRRLLNDDFVRRSFRDVADQDYILARMAFRSGLNLQVITLSHQAIERYLKAILLFNDLSVKAIEHDIVKGLAAVRNEISFVREIPVAVDEFVSLLNRQASRYFEWSFGVSGRTILALDMSVWHIRRYCEDMHRLQRTADGTVREEIVVGEWLHSPDWSRKPHRFRHSTGFLEKVLDGEESLDLRRHLILRNAYYGRRRNIDHRSFGRFAGANPTLTLHPEAFAHFDRLVKFSRAFRRRHAGA